jgi:hypothetical protein
LILYIEMNHNAISLMARRMALLLLLPTLAVAACQSGDGTAPLPEGTVDARQAAAGDDGMDWSLAGDDCLAKLATLRRGLAAGRIRELETTPFFLVRQAARRGGGRSPLTASTRTIAGKPDARCRLQVGPPRHREAERRVIARESIRSAYESGVRTDKNPAYDVAQAKLREAERRAKTKPPSIIKVGDPMLDLVGLVVGSLVGGVSQRFGSDAELQRALDELVATPRSIDRPLYRRYGFERSRVGATRAAVMTVTLTDRSLGRSWQADLRQRETKEFLQLDGLDPRDRDYALHHASSISDADLERWLEAGAEPAIGDLAAVLLDGTGPAAAGGPIAALDEESPPAALDAAILPAAPATAFVPPTIHDATGEMPPDLVLVGSDDETSPAIYVAPRLVLAAALPLAGRGVVEMTTASGWQVLGLVVTIDRTAGLALIQIPESGRPTPLAQRHDRTVQGRMSGRSDGTAEIGPVVEAGRLLAFVLPGGERVPAAAIRTFLVHEAETLEHLGHDLGSLGFAALDGEARPPGPGSPPALDAAVSRAPGR